MRKPETGDKVEFRTGRGRVVKGTIADLKWRERRIPVGLRYLMKKSEYATGELIATIADADGNGAWTVPVSQLRVLGKGDSGKAKSAVQKVRDGRQEARFKRLQRNCEEGAANGLNRVRMGDTVIVTFRGGIEQEVIFKGYVAGSGNVRFEQDGRVRTSPAKFVRPKKGEK